MNGDDAPSAALKPGGRPGGGQALLIAAAPVVFVVLWATGFIFGKLGLPYTEPATFLVMRYGIVFVLMGALALILKRRWPGSLRLAAHSAIVGVLLHVFYIGGVFAGIERGVPAGIASLIVGLQPLLTATIVGPMLGESVSGRQWTGLALGLAGVALVLNEKIALGAGTPAGYLLCAGGLVAITLGTVYQKKYAQGVDMVAGAVLQYGAATVGALAFAVLFESMRVIPSADLAIALAWLCIVLSVFTVSLLMFMIRRGEAGKVASLFYLVPVVAALMAWPLFGETLGLLAMIGMGVTIAGVALAMRG